MKNGIIESYEDLEKIKEIKCLKQENQQLKEQLKEAEKILCKVMDCREDREFYRDLAYEYYAKRSEMK